MSIRHAFVRTVGILTMPQKMGSDEKGAEPFIINNNVKWFTDRGIDILPIPYNTKSPEKFMGRIHGLYLQGGPVYNADYMKTAVRFIDLAVAANKKGEYFPVWGTCHGFQTLIMKFGEMDLNGRRLGYFDARSNYRSNVHITRRGDGSQLVRSWPKWFKGYLEKGNNVYFANMRGITPEAFMGDDVLRRAFTIVGISLDRDKKRFVSIIEAKKGLPFYGTQFHPEAVPTLEPFRSFFVDEILKNHKKKQSRFVKTFRQRHRVRHCTRCKRCFNHNKFQDSECYFF
jgi:gamma-glutamyl hydrolase